MLNIENLHPKYITDESGKKISVILSVEEYRELLEDFEDLLAFTKRENEETIPHETVLEELKKVDHYKITWKKSAVKELKVLDKATVGKILEKIEDLSAIALPSLNYSAYCPL